MKVYAGIDPLTGCEIRLRKTCKTERAAQIELRQYQLAGHDISQLIDRITAAPMVSARSISSVLHGRLQHLQLPDLGHDVTWAQRTPGNTPQIAHELAAGRMSGAGNSATGWLRSLNRG